MAERQREVRNRQPRVRVPHRRADEDLQVDERRRRRRDAAAGSDRRVQVRRPAYARFHPGDVDERDRRSSGRRRSAPGWRARSRSDPAGYHSTVMPPRMPCVITAPARCSRAGAPSARLRAPQPDGEHEDQEADGAGDEPMRVLEANPADHLLERKREHEPAVGVRPVGHRQPRTRARDEAAGEDQDGR